MHTHAWDHDATKANNFDEFATELLKMTFAHPIIQLKKSTFRKITFYEYISNHYFYFRNRNSTTNFLDLISITELVSFSADEIEYIEYSDLEVQEVTLTQLLLFVEVLQYALNEIDYLNPQDVISWNIFHDSLQQRINYILEINHFKMVNDNSDRPIAIPNDSYYQEADEILHNISGDAELLLQQYRRTFITNDKLEKSMYLNALGTQLEQISKGPLKGTINIDKSVYGKITAIFNKFNIRHGDTKQKTVTDEELVEVYDAVYHEIIYLLILPNNNKFDEIYNKFLKNQ